MRFFIWAEVSSLTIFFIFYAHLCIFNLNFRQKEELIKELAKSDKEAKDTKKQYSEKIKFMKQELEKAKKELEESKKTLEEYESRANYEVAEKQKVETEYKKKLQAVEAKLQALKRKQKVRFLFGLQSKWQIASISLLTLDRCYPVFLKMKRLGL